MCIHGAIWLSSLLSYLTGRPICTRLGTTHGFVWFDFVVNTLRSESDLRQLGPEERREMADSMGADLVTSMEEYRKLDHSRRFGQEIWKPLLAFVLFLLLFELWFERRMARQRVSR